MVIHLFFYFLNVNSTTEAEWNSTLWHLLERKKFHLSCFLLSQCTAWPILLTSEILWESKSAIIILSLWQKTPWVHAIYLVDVLFSFLFFLNEMMKWMTGMAMRMIYHDVDKGRQFEAGLYSEGHVRYKTGKWQRLWSITCWKGPAIGEAM